jgi:cGMP-dependent protein kinase 2
MMQLQMKGTPSHMPAWVHIKRRKRNSRGQTYWEVVKAKGHMDEVQALTKPAGVPTRHVLNRVGEYTCLHVNVVARISLCLQLSRMGVDPNASERRTPFADAADTSIKLSLVEGKVLGGGAFSRVSKVIEDSNQRAYAMKRMRKATVLQCPDHVFCEQIITRNTAHPFCIRQVRLFHLCSRRVTWVFTACSICSSVTKWAPSSDDGLCVIELLLLSILRILTQSLDKLR